VWRCGRVSVAVGYSTSTRGGNPDPGGRGAAGADGGVKRGVNSAKLVVRVIEGTALL